MIRDNVFMTDAEDKSTIDRSGARETAFTYDFEGRQTSRTLPEGETEYFYYNDLGQQVRHLSLDGRVTVFEYDNSAGVGGRLESKLYFDTEADWQDWTEGTLQPDQTISYKYDAYGRTVEVNDSENGITTTEYTDLGQIASTTSPQGTINYSYDKATGQLLRTWTGTDTDNPVTDVGYTYDVLGRLETVKMNAREGAALASPEVTQYVYDVLGNLSRINQSNGVVSEYTYDLMNRLEQLTHYAPDATPQDLSDNAILQRFVYSRYDNGMKAGEVFYDSAGNMHIYDWKYDKLGRLIEESLDSADDSLDYTTDYKFDLVGNRLEKKTDKDGDGTFEEVLKSAYDNNDRLLNTRKLVDDVAVEETIYGFEGTEQVLKRVVDLLTGEITSETSMEYNLQGRMSKLTINSYVDGVLSNVTTQEFTYDDSGIKVTQTEKIDADADGTFDSEKLISYLNDMLNHTGYSQVLEETETVTDENGTTVKKTTYTIGHDIIAQAGAAVGVLTLLADGHGSTRAVTDASGNILQQYMYDAYGQLLNMGAGEALTQYLYSGEQFNPVSGLQYLRARWYSPQSGRFNRLDPYEGDFNDPLSLHKYAYVLGNPINGIDPSGLFTLGEISFSMGIIKGMAAGFAIGGIAGGVISAIAGGNIFTGIGSGGVAGAAIAFTLLAFPGRIDKLITVIANGMIAGISGVVGGYLQHLFRHGINGPEYPWGSMVDKFLHGFGWGTASKAFGSLPFPNKKNNPFYPVTAAILFAGASETTKIVTEYIGDKFTNDEMNFDDMLDKLFKDVPVKAISAGWTALHIWAFGGAKAEMFDTISTLVVKLIGSLISKPSTELIKRMMDDDFKL